MRMLQECWADLVANWSESIVIVYILVVIGCLRAAGLKIFFLFIITSSGNKQSRAGKCILKNFKKMKIYVRQTGTVEYFLTPDVT